VSAVSAPHCLSKHKQIKTVNTAITLYSFLLFAEIINRLFK
jgi:hypothetical protein